MPSLISCSVFEGMRRRCVAAEGDSAPAAAPAAGGCSASAGGWAPTSATAGADAWSNSAEDLASAGAPTGAGGCAAAVADPSSAIATTGAGGCAASVAGLAPAMAPTGARGCTASEVDLSPTMASAGAGGLSASAADLALAAEPLGSPRLGALAVPGQAAYARQHSSAKTTGTATAMPTMAPDDIWLASREASCTSEWRERTSIPVLRPWMSLLACMRLSPVSEPSMLKAVGEHPL
mmetsp:Transcript_66986/g.195849  ORF Transcript_66986/g.195849 Transcript_66986/m.195849 type:complete len:236 (-) Transcript_66986:148-855(-)